MTETRSLERIVASLPIFAGRQPEHLELITGCAANVRFEAGAMIFREGEPADRFYAIRRGQVAVEVFFPQRGSVAIQTLREGDVLNWSWLFPPYLTLFDARCLTMTRAIAFDGECLRGKCDADHSLGYDLMKRFALIMVERMRAARLQLLDIYGDERHA